jgi:hypothetical protein
MECHALMADVMLEFLNTFFIKGVDIYFGHKNKVYVISKQLIGACVGGYVEEPKRQVSKSLVIQALYNCRLAFAILFAN